MGLLVKHPALILLMSCYQDYRIDTGQGKLGKRVCFKFLSEKSLHGIIILLYFILLYYYILYYLLYIFLHIGKDSTYFIGLFASIK